MRCCKSLVVSALSCSTTDSLKLIALVSPADNKKVLARNEFKGDDASGRQISEKKRKERKKEKKCYH